MIQTGFESRVKVQQIVENQLPSFILEENANAVEFLKQYYISQEYQGGPIDIVENLDQYLNLENLTPEVVVDSTTLLSDIQVSDTEIQVSSTKGFPQKYGLLRIDDEIITYTGIIGNTFTGCVRGFSGITNYHQELNREELTFSTSSSSEHTSGTSIKNLSSLFLKEFYKKLKYTIAPGLENVDFHENLDVGNFLSKINSFYAAKGTNDSIRILFNVLYNETPAVINLEDYLLKPSYSEYEKVEVVVIEKISGYNPLKLRGQTIKKLNDDTTNAAVSYVEPFSKDLNNYYKLNLYVGNSEFSAVEGDFSITPSTKTTSTVEAFSSVITVDSTIGFPESGVLYVGDNLITYTNKSINQFLGCSGIETALDKNLLIRTNEIYYGYEDGDLTKKVEFRILGVLSNLVVEEGKISVSENDIITLENLGDKIENPKDKTHKEIFANSWIYNTATRYRLKSINPFILEGEVDKSSIKVGDRVELLERNTEVVVPSYNDPHVAQINLNNIVIEGSFDTEPNRKYDLRRKINTSSSINVPIEYGNNLIFSDIQNLYTDGDEYAYVASNSLPSSSISGFDYPYRYDITTKVKVIESSNLNDLGDIDPETTLYTTISFDEDVPFLTGDQIYYESTESPLAGLNEGIYYVEVLQNVQNQNRKIRLYYSQSLINGLSYIKFGGASNPYGIHKFRLFSQRDSEISGQKIFKKFPLQKNIKGFGKETIPGYTGMMINGVEIANYKSYDKIYYGPIESIDVLSGGNNFDVINPPLIEIESGNAKVQPVITGSFVDVLIESQDYDIDKILSLDITGGNGQGAILDPIISKRGRSISFDGRTFDNGGGINTTSNKIFFTNEHNLSDGEEIIYNSNGNSEIPTFDGSEIGTLINDSSYFVKVVNNSTVSLFETFDDYSTNSNLIQFFAGSSGSHKFTLSKFKNTISEIRVIDGGSGYTNRKLVVDPSNVSLGNNSISFENHGFNTGELVVYDYENSQISGLSTSNQYYIVKIDDNSFRLCDAGIGGTNKSNFNTLKYSTFNNSGSGYQYFSYPPISVSLKYNPVAFGTSTQLYEEISLTPIVKGKIDQLYVYDGGTGYGSTTLNYKKNPQIKIKNGKNALLKPNISNGQIISVTIQSPGSEYYSLPDLTIYDPSGLGSGAKLIPVISNGSIVDVKIEYSGIGYSDSSTIRVVPSGSNAKFDSNIRALTINGLFKYGNELLSQTDNKLKYSIIGYFDDLRSAFSEASISNPQLSGIIGWAYDGNPIYGPFGYSDPEDNQSGASLIESSYVLDTSYVDRPIGFSPGFFVEDYKFNNSGDLDKNNGRFAKTPDFPNGVYAYYATIDSLGNPYFPYFIGNTYRSQTLEENESLGQSYDFSSSNLLRNTFPYKILEPGSSYDFIPKTNSINNQKIIVNSVSSGSIDGFEVKYAGEDYKVNDILEFDNENTGGAGSYATVSFIDGKEVSEINTITENDENSTFVWLSPEKVKVFVFPNHNLNNKDYVNISGFSTSLVSLNKSFKINVETNTCVAISSISAATSIGGTEIYVSNVPKIDIGTNIKIGSETLKVLEIYRDKNALRVERGLIGVSHDKNSIITFLPNSFTIDAKLDYFDSSIDDVVFFNALESVGFGTIVGINYSTTYDFADNTGIQRGILSKSIYLEDHPFKTNDLVEFTANGAAPISISTDGVNTSNLPSEVYIISKTENLIGIKTEINSEEVFFHPSGSDSDLYSFKKINKKITGNIKKIRSTVSISTITTHSMNIGDIVRLNVEPKLSVGIGTSTAVRVIYDSEIENIIINPIGFSSTNVDINENTITLVDHNLKTGDKILYEDGSSKSEYYIYKVDKNNIKLCETYIDATNTIPTTVGIADTGAFAQYISLINPRIQSVRNNNLTFDLSDPSLLNYNFKIYRDREFKDEFVSTGSNNLFNLKYSSTIGTVGAALTISYDSSLPEKLYYNLEKSGYISTSDKDVINYSEILYTESSYNGEYEIVGITSTTFDIILQDYPENNSYTIEDCEKLTYITSSKTEKGPINKIKIISSGLGYKKIPRISNIITTEGKNSYIIPNSNTIGKLLNYTIQDEEFIYSFDPTLKPKASISPNVIVENSNALTKIFVTDGGRGYVSSPDIILVNPLNDEILNNGLLYPVLNGESINSVSILDTPKGLPENGVTAYTINNSNGISIVRVDSSSTGIFTCYITIPPLGYTVDPFVAGEEVFIEGIQKFSSDGDGFNSEDYGYKFFKINNYIQSQPYDKVEIDLSDIENGLTNNTGIAKTIQDGFANIISKNDYPTFEIVQSRSYFINGEQLLVDGNFTNLYVSSFDGTRLKVSGSYNLTEGNTIVGKESGNIGLVSKIVKNEGFFEVDYSITKNRGWRDEVGKLSIDNQVTPNNDYYQNLSYSIKSSKDYENNEKYIKPLVHTSGLKDFADMQITKDADNYTEVDGIDSTTITFDLTDDLRVDTINTFDLAYDYEYINNQGTFIKLVNKRLSDYVDNIENDVISIDDISGKFSFYEDIDQADINTDGIDRLQPNISYQDYLIKAKSSSLGGGNQLQLTQVTILNNGTNNYILEKGSVSNINPNSELHDPDEKYGEISIYQNNIGDDYLKFVPAEEYTYDIDYDIKSIKTVFSNTSTGVGTTSIGFIDLTSSNIISSTGSLDIASFDNNSFKSLYANIQIIDNVTNKINFADVYVTSDQNNTYLSEFYSDSSTIAQEFTTEPIGLIDSEILDGYLKLKYSNYASNNTTVRAKIVGFGTITSGIGTYRFATDAQRLIEGSERTAIYQSNFVSGIGSNTIFTVDRNLFDSAKSIVEVGVGSLRSVHQLMMIQDGVDAYLQESAFLTVSETSGIGSFIANISGSNFELVFYPDSEYSAENIELKSFTELLYTDYDVFNEPNNLVYGSNIESVKLYFINAINGDRINSTSFNATSDGIKIFTKNFDPNSSSLNKNTGVFTIPNHFFKNNEELIYTPKSTIISVAATAMEYRDSDSLVEGTLPSTVFAIVSDYDRFQISTTRSGTAVTFTDLGSGNYHQFEMKEKNSKSIIVIDNLIQSPISFSQVTHNLSDSIGSATTIFNLTGISSINPTDLLKIDDEYLLVVNVGLGTTSTGPIENIGSFNLVEVERGFVGTISTEHNSSTNVDVYRGSYNIVENKINFVYPPRGNSFIEKDDSDLDAPKSSFSGRVFLKSDYSSNKVYDDISESFNGIGRTFTLQVGGANTSGIGTVGGNGIVLLNGLYQQPSTDNNPNGNFDIFDDSVSGITTIVFSGITAPNDPLDYISSEDDVNQNETPRGGIIVSYGSTPGLGFAPLVGASITATVSAGSIIGITTNIIGGNYGSGYNGLTSIGVTVYEEGHSGTPASIEVSSIGIGGTLSFNIVDPGTGYNNPQIFVAPPSYENLPVIGVSRLSIGSTTETGIGLSVSLNVGPVYTTGTGSTYFGVTEFEITKRGYSFQRGDVFKPVGLVTDSRLLSPLEECEFVVLDTFADKFSAWEFGNVDFIDSIAIYQDGVRTIFPLFYNGDLLSFETPSNSRIRLENNLLIFINGVLQVPGVSYNFGGGTSVRFTTAPIPEDKISIYFYRGYGSDSVVVTNINETLRKGDVVQLVKNNEYPDVPTQNKRTITNISYSDRFETNVYSGPGLSENIRPLSWTKQKVDKKISGEFVYKFRDSLESLVYPVSNIIYDVGANDYQIFVDNVDLFRYENPILSPGEFYDFDAIVVNGISTISSGNVESIKNFNQIQGSSGLVIGIGSTSSPNLAIEFTIDPLNGTDLEVGYPIYVYNTLVGTGVTSIISSDSEILGIGTEYLDNIYIVESLNPTTGIITCRVHSASDLSGISTTGLVGNYSWGKLGNPLGLERSSNPISIGVSGSIVSGLSTYPIIQRRGIGLRENGSLPRVSVD